MDVVIQNQAQTVPPRITYAPRRAVMLMNNIDVSWVSDISIGQYCPQYMSWDCSSELSAIQWTAIANDMFPLLKMTLRRIARVSVCLSFVLREWSALCMYLKQTCVSKSCLYVSLSHLSQPQKRSIHGRGRKGCIFWAKFFASSSQGSLPKNLRRQAFSRTDACVRIVWRDGRMGFCGACLFYFPYYGLLMKRMFHQTQRALGNRYLGNYVIWSCLICRPTARCWLFSLYKIPFVGSAVIYCHIDMESKPMQLLFWDSCYPCSAHDDMCMTSVSTDLYGIWLTLCKASFAYLVQYLLIWSLCELSKWSVDPLPARCSAYAAVEHPELLQDLHGHLMADVERDGVSEYLSWAKWQTMAKPGLVEGRPLFELFELFFVLETSQVCFPSVSEEGPLKSPQQQATTGMKPQESNAFMAIYIYIHIHTYIYIYTFWFMYAWYLPGMDDHFSNLTSFDRRNHDKSQLILIECQSLLLWSSKLTMLTTYTLW